jgi:hypothetical protein
MVIWRVWWGLVRCDSATWLNVVEVELSVMVSVDMLEVIGAVEWVSVVVGWGVG